MLTLNSTTEIRARNREFPTQLYGRWYQMAMENREGKRSAFVGNHPTEFQAGPYNRSPLCYLCSSKVFLLP